VQNTVEKLIEAPFFLKMYKDQASYNHLAWF